MPMVVFSEKDFFASRRSSSFGDPQNGKIFSCC